MWGNAAKPQFGPLNDVKVVFSAASTAAPFGVQLLGDFGADVVWIENALIPDVSRVGNNVAIDNDRRNCRTIALNTPTEEGKKIFLALMKDADIFVESSKAGQWDKWGLSDQVLWEANPALVIVHVSGFGQTGDPYYTKRPSYDAIAQAFSGLVAQNGVTLAPYIGDYMTASYVAFACVTGLHAARRTGKGESIDLAQYEVILRSSNFAVDYATDHKVYAREKKKHEHMGGWGMYAANDGKEVYICCIGGGSIKNACKFFGMPYGSEEIPKGVGILYVGSPGGILLEKNLSEFVAAHTAEEAERELLAAGIAASRIMSYEDIVNNSHVKERGVFQSWENLRGKQINGAAPAPKFKNNPGKVWRPAPTIGMDNEQILSELGYGKEEIEKLYADKVINKVDFLSLNTDKFPG